MINIIPANIIKKIFEQTKNIKVDEKEVDSVVEKMNQLALRKLKNEGSATLTFYKKTKDNPSAILTNVQNNVSSEKVLIIALKKMRTLYKEQGYFATVIEHGKYSKKLYSINLEFAEEEE